MSNNRKNRKEPAFLRNFTNDVLKRKIWLEENYASEHNKTIEELRTLTEELNKYIQDLNMIIPRNIPYMSINTTTDIDQAVRLFIRQKANFNEVNFLLQIENTNDYISITHLIDLFVSEGIFEIDGPINDYFNVEIIFNSVYTRMIIIDIFLDVAFYNSYSFLLNASTEEKKQFSKKKFEYFKNHKLTSCFEEINDKLDYYSFAFSCHDLLDAGDFSINLTKYVEIWEDFIKEYYPNFFHKEKSIEEQISKRVDEHLPIDYYKEFDSKDPGIYFIIRLNRGDLSPEIYERIAAIFGGEQVNFSNLKIVTKAELDNYIDLLKDLYISAFKIVKQVLKE